MGKSFMSTSDSDLLKLFQTIIDNLPSGVSLRDKDQRLTVWNSEFRRLLSFPDELFEPEPPDLYKLALYNARRGEYGPGDPEELAKVVIDRARKMQPYVYERTRPDGTVLEIRGQPLPDGGFVSIFANITDRKHAEEEVRHTAAYFQAVLDNLPIGVLLADKEMRCVYWNKQSKALLDIPDDFVFKEIPLEVVLTRVAESGAYGSGNIEEQVAKRMALIRNFEPHTVELDLRGGTLHVRGAPILIGGVAAGFILLQEDITERKNYQNALEHLAATDHLTNLLNRRAFLDAMEKEMRRAHRYGHPLTLLMLDVDHFKRINDTYGHPAGDEVLRRIAATTRRLLRDEDLTGRLGGEEFAIALVQAPLIAAAVVAERLRKIISELVIDFEGRQISVTVSIGVAEFGADAGNLTRLVTVADERLYAAKHSGRNCVVSMHADATGA
jgi:diguanylate cyclase (GGDEF)-like protein